MMILCAHQPTYAPWLGLIEKVARADTFVWFDGVPMEDSGYENRVQIRTREGSQWLSVPVHRGRDILVRDIEIAGDLPWRRKHLRSWEMHYSRSPYYEQHIPFLREVYSHEWKKLGELNEHIVRYLLSAFSLAPRWIYMSELGEFTTNGSALVLDVCERVGASHYIFGRNGRDYADVEAFGRAGITVEFQEYNHPEYRQAFEGFVPFMSAFDLLMNYPESEALELMLSGGDPCS
jgi:hypothetical protein